jgi:hypothetical protein
MPGIRIRRHTDNKEWFMVTSSGSVTDAVRCGWCPACHSVSCAQPGMQVAVLPARPMPQEEAPLDVKAASWATDAHVTLKSHTSAQLLRKPSTLLSHPAALPGEGPCLLVPHHA